jgi:hypothetical protein
MFAVSKQTKTNVMKALLLTAFFFLQMASAISQDAATGMNSRRVQKAKPRQQWLMRYEKMDTTDSKTGQKFTVTRAYYFNKKWRQLQTVQIQEVNKRHGLAVTYSYYNNQLTKVTVTPPKSECRKCTRQYLYLDNKLYQSNDTSDVHRNAYAYLNEAVFLKGKMPDKLDWGYFEWERSDRSNESQNYLIVDADGRLKH